MPSHSRRALLLTLAGTASTLAGCQSDIWSATNQTTPSTASGSTGTTATPTTRTPEEPPQEGIGGDLKDRPETVWPTPDRGPSNAAYLPAGPDFEAPPSTAWELAPVNPDEDHYSPRYLQPVVDGETLYVVNAVIYGTNVALPETQYLRAVNTSGEERWTAPLSAGDSAPVPSLPAVHEEFVLVGLDQVLGAYDRATGDTVWTVAIDGGVHSITPTTQRVIIRASRAIVAVADGEKQWTVPFETYPSAMAVGPETVFVGSSKRISALDPATGKRRWREDLPAVDGGWGVSSVLAVPGGVVVRQNSGHVYAFSSAGEAVWRTQRRNGGFATDGRSLYASDADSIRSLRVADGSVIWERTCDEIPGCDGTIAVRDIAATADTVIASLADGLVVGLAARTGSVQWTTQAPITIDGIALTGTAIYGVGDIDDPLLQLTT
ncbi:PQQ-like beta-propeller repeat protein [Haloarcula sp. S1AR25-5A]|uniref:PQQ-like beta-propeller repeat protein n=1 Tax=Haloarcula terrestris TaxID=2950533 RepID=A0AAE4EXY9_9EURY|nr:PQQ-binding-like beta-propeller repeat protein [Haloarcula terrestris]MDS0222128.1 PQQ-like beta-propeller repeat protein [Haloarcula terrestris]